mgnify:CR=1 FL=1
MNKFFVLIFASLLLFSCATSRHFPKKLEKEINRSSVFSGAFTGFVLRDPATGKTLCEVNGAKYFTTASNTKLLTLYTCLRTLGDSLPALRWQSDGENLYFEGTGDPTFLHPVLGKYSPVYQFLRFRPEKNLVFSPYNFDDSRFGNGWAWDDFGYNFQCERSPMPIYGNRMAVVGKELTVNPPRFRHFLNPTSIGTETAFVQREELGDRLSISAKADIPENFKQEIPIFWGNLDFNLFLKDTLFRPITTPAKAFFEKLNPRDWQTLFGAPTDTVLRAMMLPSDNFLAEQLLMVCGGKLTDTLSVGRAIEASKKKFLADLPDQPRWFDGSGLSRYDLETPRNMAFLLEKIWHEQPRARVFNLFAAGGLEGTVRDWYKPAPGQPAWLYAKTGTLGGVHCLSGYLTARSGKVLVFSFMHNNFKAPSATYKKEMERVLLKIREAY